MSVNKYDSTSGTLTSIAAGSRTWIGTRAAYDAEKQAGTLPTNCIIVITDDEVDMDTVPTENSPVAVTSGGLYDAFTWRVIDTDTDLRTVDFREISIHLQFYTGTYFNFACLTWPKTFLIGYRPMKFTFENYSVSAIYNGSSSSSPGTLTFYDFKYNGTDITSNCTYSYQVR